MADHCIVLIFSSLPFFLFSFSRKIQACYISKRSLNKYLLILELGVSLPTLVYWNADLRLLHIEETIAYHLHWITFVLEPFIFCCMSSLLEHFEHHFPSVLHGLHVLFRNIIVLLTCLFFKIDNGGPWLTLEM